MWITNRPDLAYFGKYGTVIKANDPNWEQYASNVVKSGKLYQPGV